MTLSTINLEHKNKSLFQHLDYVVVVLLNITHSKNVFLQR
jgi:hypothetical protein